MTTTDDRTADDAAARIGVIGASDSVAAATRSALKGAGLEVGEVAAYPETRELAAAVERAAPAADALAVVLDGRDPTRTLVRAVEAATVTTPTVVFAPRRRQAGLPPTAGRPEDGDRPIASGGVVDWAAVRRRAIERAGGVLADSLGELVDAVESLATQPSMTGDRVAIVSNAGGPGVMAADAVGTAGLSLASFGSGTRETLADLIPEAGARSNPVDLLGDADLDAFATATDLVCGDPNVDAVVVVSAPSALFSFEELARTLAAVVRDRSVPVVAVLMGGEPAGDAGQVLSAAGVPVRFDPFAAVDCLAALEEDDRPGFPPVDEPPDPDRGWWGSVDRTAVETAIEEDAPLALCRAYGIPTDADVGADPVGCSLRVVRDPALGPTVVAGVDPFDEVLGDVGVRLAPLSDRDATALFDLRAGPLLRGARGRPAVDFGSLRDVALRCSRIAIEHPPVVRLALDPIRVGPDGVRVVDAVLSTE